MEGKDAIRGLGGRDLSHHVYVLLIAMGVQITLHKNTF